MTDPLEVKLAEAVRLRDEGRYLEALALFRALREDSEHPQDIAQMFLFEAETLTLAGEYEEAQSAEEHAKMLQPNNPYVASGAMFCAARRDRAQGRVVEGLEKLDFLIKHHPDPKWNDTLVRDRALMLAELERYEEARPHLEQALEKGETDSQVYFYLGRCHFWANKVQDGIDSLSKALASKGLSENLRPYAYLDRGIARYTLNLHQEAIADFQSCRELEEGLDAVSRQTLYLTWAYCLRALGKPEEAAEIIRVGGMLAQ